MAPPLHELIAAIDAANAADPNRMTVAGRSGPKEVVHAELMTGWVLQLDPDADEAQLVAARAHHFRRWTWPRADYPPGRAGYLRWRLAARKAQAAEVAQVLGGLGCDGAFVDRVAAIVNKDGLGVDPVVQTHEDALCLVFLQTQLDPVAVDLGDEKTVTVLAKTAKKMSPAALDLAAGLALSPAGAALLARALDPG